MKVFIAKAKDTPLGILVLHENTNVPIFMGPTPMSSFLLATYKNGIRFFGQNALSGKRDEFISKPNDLESFLDVGTRYYALVNIELNLKTDCFLDLTQKKIIVEEQTFQLIEL